MGSIFITYSIDQWRIVEEYKNGQIVKVAYADIDDYHTQRVTSIMRRDIYDKVKSGEYTVKKTGWREFSIYNENGEIVHLL